MRRPPRFGVRRDAIEDGIARVDGNELRHMRASMRLRPGGEVALIDESNTEYLGRVVNFAADHATIALLKIGAEPSADYRLILAASIIKGPRMDFLVEKVAELGATELIPLRSTHGVIQEPGHERIERWKRLSTAAAKQSLSARRMTIQPPATVAEIVAEMPSGRLAIVCDLEGAPLASIPGVPVTGDVLLACGPEGGFNAEEIAIMRGAGFVAASLGPNRLRAETAALAAVSIAVARLWEADGRD